MAHAQKPDFVFRRNGGVHLNRRWRQFSRLLAAEVCASAVVMLDTACSEVVWRVLATHNIRQFPLQFPSRASPCANAFKLEYTTHTIQGQEPLGSRKNRIFSKQTCTIFNHVNDKSYYYFLPTLYYIYVHNFNKIYTILHHWYDKICMFIVTYCISVLISGPWRRQENGAETCSSYVKNYKHKLQKSALFGVTPVIYCSTMRGMNNVSRDICR